jgi:hypothetical protein
MLPAKRLFALGACAFMLLLLATTAHAAPLSPATQFAWNAAERQVGGTGECATVDAQIVPAFASPSIVAQYSSQECYVYLSRELAGSQTFAKTCEVLVNILGYFNGRPMPTAPRLPRTCLMHDLFLLNHPHYLERRFA